MNLNNWKRTLLTLSGTIITIILTVVVEDYFDRANLDINVKHITISDTEPQKHIYVLNIRNSGQNHVGNINLFAKKSGKIYSSTFNNNITSNNIILEQSEITKLTGNQRKSICYEDSSSILINKSYSSHPQIYTKSIKSTSNQKSYSLISDNANHDFYQISYGSFALAPNEEVSASIYTDYLLVEESILCVNNQRKFNVNSIENLDSKLFQTSLFTISTATNVLSNKIFIEGCGIGTSNTIEKSKVLARTTAINNLYKETAKKLYGFTIESNDNIFSLEKTSNLIKNSNTLYEFRNNLIVKGFLDENSFTIYDEKYYSNGTEIVCELKAFYNLPMKIETNNYNIEIKSSLTNLFPPTKQGEDPDWIIRHPSHPDYYFGIGIAESNINNSRIMGRQIAFIHAIENLTKTIETKVSTITDNYIKYNDKGKESRHENLSRFITNQYLSDLKIVEYYIDREGRTYILTAISKKSLNKGLDILQDPDLVEDNSYEKFKQSYMRAMQELEKE